MNRLPLPMQWQVLYRQHGILEREKKELRDGWMDLFEAQQKFANEKRAWYEEREQATHTRGTFYETLPSRFREMYIRCITYETHLHHQWVILTEDTCLFASPDKDKVYKVYKNLISDQDGFWTPDTFIVTKIIPSLALR